jgi:hypothetical protein
MPPGPETKRCVLVDLDAVERFLTRSLRHVEEDFPVRETAVATDLVAHDHLLLRIPVGHVEKTLVRREVDSVRSLEIGREELELSFR